MGCKRASFCPLGKGYEFFQRKRHCLQGDGTVKTLIKINSADPSEAEYIAKVLINEAVKEKLSVSCSKTRRSIFKHGEYEKRVSIGK